PGSHVGAYTINLRPTIVQTDPNDQISEAQFLGPMNIDRAVQGTIDVPRDVDMYRFQVIRAHQPLSFDVDTTPGTLDAYLRIFKDTGEELRGIDFGFAPGETGSTTDPYVEGNFGPGIYYVAISSAPNSAYNAVSGEGDVNGRTTGNYTLTILNI